MGLAPFRASRTASEMGFEKRHESSVCDGAAAYIHDDTDDDMYFSPSTATLDYQSSLSLQLAGQMSAAVVDLNIVYLQPQILYVIDDLEATMEQCIAQDAFFADRTEPGAGPFEAFDDEIEAVERARSHEDSDDDQCVFPPRRRLDQWAPQRESLEFGTYEAWRQHECWSCGVYSFPFDVPWTPWHASDACEAAWAGPFPPVTDEVFGAEDGGPEQDRMARK